MPELIRIQLFSGDKKYRANVVHYYCSCPKDGCDFRKKGQCRSVNILNSKCPYLSFYNTIGYTTKSTKYGGFISKIKEEINKLEIQTWKFPSSCLTKIGEYYCLPYSHMSMCTDVPFVQHSNIFTFGSEFVRIEDFTVNCVQTLCNFRPQALMGGEITTYQRDVIPVFLFHLKYLLPEIYTLLDESTKSKILNITYQSVRAKLSHIEPGIIDGYKINDDLKILSWDGTTLKFEQEVNSTLGLRFLSIPIKGMVIAECTPIADDIRIVLTNEELAVKIAREYPETIQYR